MSEARRGDELTFRASGAKRVKNSGTLQGGWTGRDGQPDSVSSVHLQHHPPAQPPDEVQGESVKVRPCSGGSRGEGGEEQLLGAVASLGLRVVCPRIRRESARGARPSRDSPRTDRLSPCPPLSPPACVCVCVLARVVAATHLDPPRLASLSHNVGRPYPACLHGQNHRAVSRFPPPPLLPNPARETAGQATRPRPLLPLDPIPPSLAPKQPLARAHRHRHRAARTRPVRPHGVASGRRADPWGAVWVWAAARPRDSGPRSRSLAWRNPLYRRVSDAQSDHRHGLYTRVQLGCADSSVIYLFQGGAV